MALNNCVLEKMKCVHICRHCKQNLKTIVESTPLWQILGILCMYIMNVNAELTGT